ncbi:MAG: hypothetical protein ACSLE9_19360 [Burkholderiaceae bacterium]
MNHLHSNPVCIRSEWIRRFAYRAMLCRNELDTTSALALADIQFDDMHGIDPEAAAEGFVNPAPQGATVRSPARIGQVPVRQSVGSMSPA